MLKISLILFFALVIGQRITADPIKSTKFGQPQPIQQTHFLANDEEGSGEPENEDENEIPPDNGDDGPTEEESNNGGGSSEEEEGEGEPLHCPTSSNDVEHKVRRMIADDFPTDIRLPVYSRGSVPRLDLVSGMLYLKEVKLDNQPYCVERTDNGKHNLRYDFKASMLDLSGSYQWHVFNFLRRNFSEAVVLTARRVRAQFFFSGHPRKGSKSDEREINRLEDVKVESVDELDVQVSIPDQLTTSATFNRFLAYLASRVSTFVANRSRAAISQTIQEAIKSSIINHMNLNMIKHPET